MYELQVSVFSHEINVLTDLGPEVGIGSNREVLFDGKTMLLSECDIILYIWERSLLGEWILTNCEISGERKRFVVLMLILD